MVLGSERENRALRQLIRCVRLARKTGNITAFGCRVKKGRWLGEEGLSGR
jgi:hypothetical protein